MLRKLFFCGAVVAVVYVGLTQHEGFFKVESLAQYEGVEWWAFINDWLSRASDFLHSLGQGD